MEESNHNRHAFLLMLHETYEQAACLIKLLNHDRNDLYVHIDGNVKDPERAKSFLRDVFLCAGGKGALFFADSIRVTWGGFSQIAAELSLLEKATRGGGIPTII